MQVSEVGMLPSTWTLSYALLGQLPPNLSDSLSEESTIEVQHWCDKEMNVTLYSHRKRIVLSLN